MAQFYIRANKFYYAETREQYIDATDENGLKYKLPDIVDALNNGLDVFYLNRLVWLNVFLSLVLDTLFMVLSPSLIKKFPGFFFSNQRPLSSENSNLGFFQIGFFQIGFFHVQLFTLFLMALEVQCVIVCQ